MIAPSALPWGARHRPDTQSGRNIMMQYAQLGTVDISVSSICLGTMTWGEQNSEAEAHAQLDLATDMGVNFIDTAEMYPVPSRAQTYGATEEILGRWLSRRPDRGELVIATKVVGPAGSWMPHIRDANTRLDRNNIRAALEGSLRRLRTDYIDLYQVHWPERQTNYFGKLGYEHDRSTDWIPIEETLAALGECVDSGKVRVVGVSNETPWGILEYLRVAERRGLPRIASIQNPYSLLNRTFEVGLAEIAIRERVGLLAYSPLGFGVLSGKYLGGTRPAGARLTLFDRFQRYLGARAEEATRRYVEVAGRLGLSPVQLALAYVRSRPFVTSTIVGATTLGQLRENIASVDVELGDEALRAIELIHKDIPNPAP